MSARGAQAKPTDFDTLNRRIIACEKCPRLVEYCAETARTKRAAFRDWEYWGRPVANFGELRARLLIVGLAPAAHGANRTGRVFTGDRSGEWLFRALHRAGFANQPHSESRDDGLKLRDCAITAALHCAPPGNKPLPAELANCRPWFQETLAVLPVKVIVALGQIAWRATFVEMKHLGWQTGPMPKFSHGAQAPLANGRWLLGSYHPSQQNTFTGVLTEPMFDDIFRQARKLLG